MGRRTTLSTGCYRTRVSVEARKDAPRRATAQHRFSRPIACAKRVRCVTCDGGNESKSRTRMPGRRRDWVAAPPSCIRALLVQLPPQTESTAAHDAAPMGRSSPRIGPTGQMRTRGLPPQHSAVDWHIRSAGAPKRVAPRDRTPHGSRVKRTAKEHMGRARRVLPRTPRATTNHAQPSAAGGPRGFRVRSDRSLMFLLPTTKGEI